MQGGLPRLSLDLFFLFHLRATKVTQPINDTTTIIMPTIAPAERLCEELEVWASVPVVSEVRLGIVANVENEGWNET